MKFCEASSAGEVHSEKDLIVVQRLKEALKEKSSMTQEDVCNVLSNDLYERERQADKQTTSSELAVAPNRFLQKHLKII